MCVAVVDDGHAVGINEAVHNNYGFPITTKRVARKSRRGVKCVWKRGKFRNSATIR